MKYVVWAIFNSKTVGIIIPFPTEWKVVKFHGSSHHQPDKSLLIPRKSLKKIPRKFPWMFQSPTNLPSEMTRGFFSATPPAPWPAPPAAITGLRTCCASGRCPAGKSLQKNGEFHGTIPAGNDDLSIEKWESHLFLLEIVRRRNLQET